MIIGSWNIRGMNNSLKQHEVVDFFWKNKLDLFCILETRIKAHKFNSIVRRKFKNFNIIHNYNAHINGRIWIIWNSSQINIRVEHTSAQCIHCQIHHKASGYQGFISVVYAYNDGESRKTLWNDLYNHSRSIREPWLVMGDFNCVLKIEERVSNCEPNWNDVKDFNECLNEAGLTDTASTGCTYTWTNNQEGGDRKWIKLDRALCNSDWQLKYPDSYANFHAQGISDHSPIVVDLKIHTQSFPKPFKFLNCWIEDPKFKNIVEKVWSKEIRGCKMYRLVSHLKEAKHCMRELNKRDYSDLEKRTQQAKDDLLTSQTPAQINPGDINLQNEVKDSKEKYTKLQRALLSSLYHRAKIKDINLADGNSSYFHSRVAARRSMNTIRRVVDKQRKVCETTEEIADGFLDFYKALLGDKVQVNQIDTQVVN